MSNKTEHFSNKDGCGIHEPCINAFKEELARVIHKRLQVISNIMLLAVCTTKKLKNKAVYLKQYCMRYGDLCPLLKQEAAKKAGQL